MSKDDLVEFRVPGGKVTRLVKHECQKPKANRYMPGDVFTCDCGNSYTLVKCVEPFWSMNRGS